MKYTLSDQVASYDSGRVTFSATVNISNADALVTDPPDWKKRVSHTVKLSDPGWYATMKLNILRKCLAIRDAYNEKIAFIISTSGLPDVESIKSDITTATEAALK